MGLLLKYFGAFLHQLPGNTSGIQGNPKRSHTYQKLSIRTGCIISQIAEFYALAIRRKRGLDNLRKRESELQTKSQELEELNAALTVLLKRREEDKENLQDNVVINIKELELILPYIEKLKDDHLSPQQATLVSILESNIQEIVSPFAAKLSSKFLNLTPTELQVASMVKDGRSSNEIAELMNFSKYHYVSQIQPSTQTRPETEEG
jgi:hypothetical protein